MGVVARDAGRGGGAGHTLQPTAVVHEVYLKLAKADGLEVASKEHFLALAARAMRQILLNHARDKRAQKRGGEQVRVTLHDGDMAERDTDYDVIELEDALGELEAVDRVQARIVELHFFGGLTFVEIAALLSMSESTVRREWRMARAELVLLLGGDGRPRDDGADRPLV